MKNDIRALKTVTKIIAKLSDLQHDYDMKFEDFENLEKIKQYLLKVKLY